MKREIKKVDIGSVALVYGALLAALGLIFALLFLAFGSIFASVMNNSGMGAMMGGGLVMIIVLPLLYGVLGLFFGAVFGLIYNLVAPIVGGVKVYVADSM